MFSSSSAGNKLIHDQLMCMFMIQHVSSSSLMKPFFRHAGFISAYEPSFLLLPVLPVSFIPQASFSSVMTTLENNLVLWREGLQSYK